MPRTRAIERHSPSGDAFVVERDENGVIVAISDALYYADWRDDLGNERADLDLDDFACEPVDDLDRETHREFFKGLD